MDDFNDHLEALKEQNITVAAASADPADKAAEQAAKLDFPVAYGVDQAMIEGLGGYWQPTRKFAQPAEFLINPEGKIVQLSYSDGPLARTEAGDVLKLVSFLNKRAKG